MRKQYLFFDLGWTLEDETASQIDRASKTARLLSERNAAVSCETILELQEEGAALKVPSVYKYALGKLGMSHEAMEEVASRVHWNKSLLSLYPDARDILSFAGEYHYLGLIANQSAGSRERLKHYGILDLFDLVFVSDETGIEKPDIQIFLDAQSRAGCEAGQAWMVGDRLDNDVVPANSLGWNTIRVLNGYNRFQSSETSLETPDFSIGTLREIREIPAFRED